MGNWTKVNYWHSFSWVNSANCLNFLIDIMKHLVPTFDRAYEAILADTEVARHIHCRVRYEVFCRQKAFEQAAAFPSGEESDQWDRDSAHFLVREKATGRWIGAMRLVHRGARGFPLESLGCLSEDFSPRLFGVDACEISRLSLIKGADGGSDVTDDPQRADLWGAIGPGSLPTHDSEIMLGLFRAALAYSAEHAIGHWYVLINRAFARLLQRLGVQLSQAGSPCEHRGLRIPYLVDLNAGREYVSRCNCRIASVLKGGSPPYRRFSQLCFEGESPAVTHRNLRRDHSFEDFAVA